MNALVVYDSKYGNTEEIARAVAEALGGEGDARAVRVGVVAPDDVRDADLLVVGSPTHAWGPTAAIKAFVQSLPAEVAGGMRAAAFDTGFRMPLSGFAAGKIEKALMKRGCTIAAPAQRFRVRGMQGPLAEGELARAAQWARQMLAHD